MSMTVLERRAATTLAAIFSLRMLGLFMILPVVALYAPQYSGYSATLVGVAIGAYGLAQALLQIPMGLLSDRIGRRPVIAAGLALFAIGSMVAASADSMWGLIFGRALQGSGAIAAAVMALAADLTREEQRTKAMAIIGSSIGLAFAAAMVLGPVVSGWWGLSGLFWLTAGLSVLAMLVLFTQVPEPVRRRFHHDTEPVVSDLARVMANGQLLRLDFGIFILHGILMASFVMLPLQLRAVGIAADRHGLVYLGVLAVAVAGMVPLMIWAERRQQIKSAFLGAIAMIGVACGALALVAHSRYALLAAMVIYFLGFNFLEASLPSLISRLSPASYKGTALGVYSTSQFLGAFFGGWAGGWLFQHHGAQAVFLSAAALTAIWFLVAMGMHRPHLASRMLALGIVSAAEADGIAERLRAIPGVAEAVVIAEEQVAYLKVDGRHLDEQALRAFSGANA